MSIDAHLLTEGNRIQHLNAEDGLDTLFSTGGHKTSYLTGPRKLTIETQATADFGRELQFDLINNGSYAYGEILLKTQVSNTVSAGYSPYLALSMIDRVQLVSGDNRTIMDYDYASVMKSIFSTLKAEEKSHLLTGLSTASGGTSFSGETFYALIPMFWSRFWNPSGENGKDYFPLYLTSGGSTRIIITLKPLADCLASGATSGGLVSASLQCYVRSVNPEIALRHKGHVEKYEYHTAVPKTMISTTVADSTATNINLKSLAGNNITKFVILQSPVADRDTNNVYFENETACDSFILELNNDETFEVQNSREAIADKMIMGNITENTDTIQIINFSQFNDPRIYSGALNTSNLQTFTLKNYTQTTGASQYVDVIAMIHASYHIKNGNLKLSYS